MRLAFIMREEWSSAGRVKRLWEEALKLNHTPVLIDIGQLTVESRGGRLQVLQKGEKLPPFDMAYWSHSWVDKEAWVVMQALEKSGAPLYASPSMPRGDKANQTVRLTVAGVPLPTTRLASLRQLRMLWKTLTYPLIIKGTQGSQGMQVAWIGDEKEITTTVQNWGLSEWDPLVIQNVVEPLGEDIRAFVVGRHVVAAMVRKAAEGDFRANYSQGGVCTPTLLTPAEARVVLKAHFAMDSPVSGVDFVRTAKGPVVLEVNTWPGIEGLEGATGINVAEAIVQDMARRARRR